MKNLRLLSALLLGVMPYAFGATVTSTFTISARINNGCQLGGSGTGNGSFGALNFGTMVDLHNSRDVISTLGAGSIVLTCTPGTSVTIAMDGGQNGGSSALRYLINSAGTRKIGYQLYQNASRSVVWGTGAQVMSIASFPATTQTYTVYGRLPADGTSPPAGTYTDNVTVTFTF
ncbi:spore coat protein U [Salmonella enterica subsp. enterica serovar Choleraesuis]|nr:spore coat protein U [Salmonella enterica subsp. enterica serovar Choleraesuis]